MGVADGFAIHHTASAACPWNYDPAVLRMIERGEIASGYNALAYHTMGFIGGATAEARPYGAMGAATGGHNGHTIAMCAIGYFHPPFNHFPTEELINAFAREIKWCRDNGFATQGSIVMPHTWWTAGTQWATACCGENFIPMVAEIDRRSRLDTPTQAVEEDGGDMWGVFSDLIDGRVEYCHGIGGLVQFSVMGQPRAYGLPLDELNYIGYQFGGFPVRKVDAATMAALKASTKAQIGVEFASQYKA
jgi:hypothetical protein